MAEGEGHLGRCTRGALGRQKRADEWLAQQHRASSSGSRCRGHPPSHGESNGAHKPQGPQSTEVGRSPGLEIICEVCGRVQAVK
jgi:hypothetical protein